MPEPDARGVAGRGNAQVTFEIEPKGRVSGLVVHANGRVVAAAKSR